MKTGTRLALAVLGLLFAGCPSCLCSSLKATSGYNDERDTCAERMTDGVTELDLSFCNLSSSDWRKLKALKGVRSLNLSSATVGTLADLQELVSLESLDLSGLQSFGSGAGTIDAELAHLAKLPRLKHLKTSLAVTEAGLKNVAAALPALESLDLSEGSTKAAALEALQGLKALRSLRTAQGLDDEAMARLGALAGLEELYVSRSPKVTAAGLEPLARLPKLKVLSLERIEVPEAAKDTFAKLVHLEKLEVWPGLPSAVMGALAALPRLGELSLGTKDWVMQRDAPRPGDAEVAALAKLPALRRLHVHYASFTGAGLAALAGLPLEALDLHGDDALDDSAWPQLERLGSLRRLDLTGTKVTAKGAAALASIPTLEQVSLPFEALDDTVLATLSLLPMLRAINSDRNATVWLFGSKVTDAGTATLARFPWVRSLSVERLPITDAGAARLAGLVGLTDLDLSGTKIGDDGLAAVSKLSNLERLEVAETSVTPRGLEHLKGLKKLKRLALPCSWSLHPSVGDFVSSRKIHAGYDCPH